MNVFNEIKMSVTYNNKYLYVMALSIYCECKKFDCFNGIGRL